MLTLSSITIMGSSFASVGETLSQASFPIITELPILIRGAIGLRKRQVKWIDKLWPMDANG